MDEIQERGERLLQAIEENRKKKPADRVAWTVSHEREIAECFRSLLDFTAGYVSETQTTYLLVSKLLDAILPLLQAKGHFKDFIEGTAPRLRRLFYELQDRMKRGENE